MHFLVWPDHEYKKVHNRSVYNWVQTVNCVSVTNGRELIGFPILPSQIQVYRGYKERLQRRGRLNKTLSL
jgi:hypothetical protein